MRQEPIPVYYVMHPTIKRILLALLMVPLWGLVLSPLPWLLIRWLKSINYI